MKKSMLAMTVSVLWFVAPALGVDNETAFENCTAEGFYCVSGTIPHPCGPGGGEQDCEEVAPNQGCEYVTSYACWSYGLELLDVEGTAVIFEINEGACAYPYPNILCGNMNECKSVGPLPCVPGPPLYTGHYYVCITLPGPKLWVQDWRMSVMFDCNGIVE